MSPRPSFEEYSKQLSVLPNLEEKTKKVLSDIGCKYNIFTGIISKSHQKYFIVDITELGDTKILDYPYLYSYPMTIKLFDPVIQWLKDGDRVIFTLEYWGTKSNTSFLRVKKIIMQRDIVEGDQPLDLYNIETLRKILTELYPTNNLYLDNLIQNVAQIEEEIHRIKDVVDTYNIEINKLKRVNCKSNCRFAEVIAGQFTRNRNLYITTCNKRQVICKYMT